MPHCTHLCPSLLEFWWLVGKYLGVSETSEDLDQTQRPVPRLHIPSGVLPYPRTTVEDFCWKFTKILSKNLNTFQPVVSLWKTKKWLKPYVGGWGCHSDTENFPFLHLLGQPLQLSKWPSILPQTPSGFGSRFRREMEAPKLALHLSSCHLVLWTA